MRKIKLSNDNQLSAPRTVNVFPFAILFPLICIAFSGCWENGCQGALNAQSKAVHTAIEYGGWTGK